MYYPSEVKFNQSTKNSHIVQLWREIPVGSETPVSAFLKLGGKEPSCLLESIEGEKKIARYSFIVLEPYLLFQSKDESVLIKRGNKNNNFKTTDPLNYLKKLLTENQLIHDISLPRLSGGAIGYIAYDYIKRIEKIYSRKKPGLSLPELYFIFPKIIISFDHLRQKIKIIRIVNPKEKIKYKDACREIEKYIKKLSAPILIEPVRSKSGIIKSNTSKHKFINAVKKAKKYIIDGDIIQTVLSQQLRVEFKGEPFEIYRALRILNPSPYMYYFNLGKMKIIGASPEILVRLENNIANLRPIAGTRPRGKCIQEDRKLQNELLNDEKEKAEHLMLVDLGRNDLGRVCSYGSVKITKFMSIEKYSHVMHIVSDIIGKVRHNADAFDLFKATFPAGTVTGAPKIRAMDIIEEIESSKRGLYAGAVGYFDYNGNMDFAINIRTIIMKGKDAYIQAGAGIVADSIPEKEYEETLNKARGLLKAIEMAANKIVSGW
ncbi:MAG: anthranilate synthase component I [Elusimicrobia bacterium RIFOXYC2_FULL_34_12]|nr:MAG: anthranilate synthase component I [Elusimicrobia bacterium RIFOXYC2_FULL_34_12]OGS38716.1 MAG: anthranilate synthase component I [Elusimicrobia bacterium RIFOXYD2_FULL_34_30]HAM39336.1 anthranilate synthase component I [Elusimicrobiota bacterium]